MLPVFSFNSILYLDHFHDEYFRSIWLELQPMRYSADGDLRYSADDDLRVSVSRPMFCCARCYRLKRL